VVLSEERSREREILWPAGLFGVALVQGYT